MGFSSHYPKTKQIFLILFQKATRILLDRGRYLISRKELAIADPYSLKKGFFNHRIID